MKVTPIEKQSQIQLEKQSQKQLVLAAPEHVVHE